MRRNLLFALLAAVASAFPAAAERQSNFVYAAINTDLANDGTLANPNPDPLTIIAFCNATSAPKVVEAWVWPNAGDPRVLVGSQTGTTRATVAFVVPVGWHFRVTVAGQSGGTIPAGTACRVTAWWTE
jgi:hypothetical protein